PGANHSVTLSREPRCAVADRGGTVRLETPGHPSTTPSLRGGAAAVATHREPPRRNLPMDRPYGPWGALRALAMTRRETEVHQEPTRRPERSEGSRALGALPTRS